MPDENRLFLLFISPLNCLGIPYMVTGSAASMAYGLPRVTLDIDMVIEINASQSRLLPASFPTEKFYCPPADVINLEIKRASRGHFNVIHMESGFKADFYTMGDDPLHKWGMVRRRKVAFSGEQVMLAPAEYVIIRKLEYHMEGGSDKHLYDIRGMLDVSKELIDNDELVHMVSQRGLHEPWSKVLALKTYN